MNYKANQAYRRETMRKITLQQAELRRQERLIYAQLQALDLKYEQLCDEEDAELNLC